MQVKLPKKSKTKHELPSPFNGESGKVASWIRSMEVYFLLTKEDDEKVKIWTALQRIKGGKGERAEQWAAMQIRDFLASEEDLKAQDVIPQDASLLHRREGRVDAEFPRLSHPPQGRQPPFESWSHFAEELKEYFRDTETRREAIVKLQELNMKGMQIEDYCIMFKTLSE